LTCGRARAGLLACQTHPGCRSCRDRPRLAWPDPCRAAGLRRHRDRRVRFLGRRGRPAACPHQDRHRRLGRHPGRRNRCGLRRAAVACCSGWASVRRDAGRQDDRRRQVRQGLAGPSGAAPAASDRPPSLAHLAGRPDLVRLEQPGLLVPAAPSRSIPSPTPSGWTGCCLAGGQDAALLAADPASHPADRSSRAPVPALPDRR